MEIKSHLIEKINAFEHLKIADEINKMIAIKLKCKDLIKKEYCILKTFKFGSFLPRNYRMLLWNEIIEDWVLFAYLSHLFGLELLIWCNKIL